MAKLGTVLVGVGLAIAAPLVLTPAPAQLWGWVKCGTTSADVDAIEPVVNKLLDEDAVGARRPWSSPSGSAGNVVLLRGGAKAGANEGKVRITKWTDGRERTLFVFKYRRSIGHGWQTCG